MKRFAVTRAQAMAWIQAIIAGGMIFLSQPAAAEVYRWQDPQGTLNYSSAPPAIPVQNLEIRRDNHWIPYAANADQPRQPTLALTTIVPYRTDQAVMTIPVTLNQALEQIFAVDTGSSYTIISQAVADALRLQPDPELAPMTLHTANGDIQVPLVNITSLTIGELTTYNLVAAIHDLPNTTAISGLLGLNLLDRFTLTVDTARQQMTFTPVISAAPTTSATTATSAVTFQEHDCVRGKVWMQQGARLNDGSDQEAWLYQQALAVCPNLLEAYYRLGHVLYQQAAYPSAIAIHERLIQVAPDQAEAYYRLGVLYMLNRQFEFAQEAFEHTLRLDPAHPQSRDYLRQLQEEKE